MILAFEGMGKKRSRGNNLDLFRSSRSLSSLSPMTLPSSESPTPDSQVPLISPFLSPGPLPVDIQGEGGAPSQALVLRRKELS